MATKAERAEALERMRDALKACRPTGNATLEIRWVGGMPTSTGRSDYYELRVWRILPDRDGKKRPRCSEWLTMNAAILLGYRFNKSREAVQVGGCGFNKAHQIASELAHAAGHALYVEGAYNGMVNP